MRDAVGLKLSFRDLVSMGVFEALVKLPAASLRQVQEVLSPELDVLLVRTSDRVTPKQLVPFLATAVA